MYLIKILRLDPTENDGERAAFYETAGVTRDPVVRVFFERQAMENIVDPSECWALASEITWPRPIRRFVLTPIDVVGTVTAAEALLRERGFTIAR